MESRKKNLFFFFQKRMWHNLQPILFPSKYSCNYYTGSKLHNWQKKPQLYGPFLWMGFNCLKARATSGRQFIFYHYIPKRRPKLKNKVQLDLRYSSLLSFLAIVFEVNYSIAYLLTVKRHWRKSSGFSNFNFQWNHSDFE